jgi:predicted Zn-dependent protease
MRRALRLAVVAAFAAAVLTGAWLAMRGTGPDRRNLDALVTVGGDLARDATHPILDLTRMSESDEAALGSAIDQEVRASMPVGGDPRLEGYLRRVLQSLAPHVSRGGIPYAIALVRSREVNAFAVPGGRIYVMEGLLDFVKSEAELAAVIGHEISHVDLRHCIERMQAEQKLRRVSPGIAALARLGHELVLRGYAEEEELEADRNAARLVARARYDPWEAMSLFARTARMEAPRERAPTRDPWVEIASAIPEALRRYLATHPPADQRVEAVRETLRAEPELWLGERRYVGRVNLARRRAMADEPVESEWIARPSPPG